MGGCELTGDSDYSDTLTDIYATNLGRMADNLLHGTLSLEQWYGDMRGAIDKMYAMQAKAGESGDESLVTEADRQRIEENVTAQYEYLNNFMSDIEDALNEDGASLDFIPSRAALYAKSSKAEFWRQASGDDLPAYPGDGSSECLGNCGCRWECRDGRWYWVRGKDDSCATCIQREDDWSPWES